MPSTPLKSASYLFTVVEYDIKNSCVLTTVVLVSNRLLSKFQKSASFSIKPIIIETLLTNLLNYHFYHKAISDPPPPPNSFSNFMIEMHFLFFSMKMPRCTNKSFNAVSKLSSSLL